MVVVVSQFVDRRIVVADNEGEDLVAELGHSEISMGAEEFSKLFLAFVVVSLEGNQSHVQKLNQHHMIRQCNLLLLLIKPRLAV